MSFINELKRRNVFRVSIGYIITAWLLLQVVDLVLENVNAPDWVMQVFMLALAIGFPLAVFFAWAFEMTPEGVKRESQVDRSQSITPNTGRKLDRSIIIVLVLAVIILLFQQFGNRPAAEPTTTLNQPSAQATVTDATSSNRTSVAVLPFVNMSSDPEQEYFSDGLSEELLNRLTQNTQLHVAARTSAFQFKGQNLDISEIGRKLNVANVLEGSVRKSGNRMRITAQLIKVENGFHLWSQTYDREIDDVFAIQDEISAAITKALEVELGATVKPNNTQPTENLEAYNLYLKARHLLAKRGEQNMLQANELFEQAVTLDPEFSLAWSGMAFNSSLLLSYSFDITPQEGFDLTMLAANKAIKLDPVSAEAYIAIGRVQGDLFKWQAAKENFEHAYRLAPDNVGVLNLYGDFKAVIGDFEGAIRLKKQAISLDPLSAVHAADLAYLLLAVSRNEEAVLSARRGVEMSPDSFTRRHSLIWALFRTSAFAEAKSLIEQSEQSSPTGSKQINFIQGWWAGYYYSLGDVAALRKILADNIQVKGSELVSGIFWPSEVAYFLFWLDGPEAALPWFEKSWLEHDGGLTVWEFFYLPELMSDDPDWLNFWNKPEFKELHDIRRGKHTENVSFWKERPQQ